jgi:hypothetical protein
MQHRIIYNKFTRSRVLTLLVIITTSVMADSNISYSYAPQYSLRVAGDQPNPWQPDRGQFDYQQSNPRQSNPWALPETTEDTPGFQKLPKYRSQRYQGDQYQGNQTGKYGQGFRFVTPQILESLKRQQTQNQMMSGSEQYQRYKPQQPTRRHNDYPSYGMGYTDPLYDAPAASPWGSGPDVLYRGQSLPWVPDEAIGGIPPILIPPFAENDNPGASGYDDIEEETNVFNPFNFGRKWNLQ